MADRRRTEPDAEPYLGATTASSGSGDIANLGCRPREARVGDLLDVGDQASIAFTACDAERER